MSSLRLELRRVESTRGPDLRFRRRMTRRVSSKSNLVRGSNVLARRTLRRTSKSQELLLPRQTLRVREEVKKANTIIGNSLREMVTTTNSTDNLLTTEVQSTTREDSTSNKDHTGSNHTTKETKISQEDLSKCSTAQDLKDPSTTNSVHSTLEIVQASSQEMASSSKLRDNLTALTKEKHVTTSTIASTVYLLLATSRTDAPAPDLKAMPRLPSTLSQSTRPTLKIKQGETQEFRSS